jgi:hypothetical protein
MVGSHKPIGSRAAVPARYPPDGCWPAVMRADMAAAYLDFPNTTEFARAVRRGEAPPPISYRGAGRLRQPVWSKAIIDHFAMPTKPARDPSEDLLCLV